MTASNHVVTGALIGAAIANPIAIPLAFFAHFVLDALPHYGVDDHTSRKFIFVYSADFGLASAVLLTLVLLQPQNWFLIALCGIACASPDLMWLPRWILELKDKKLKPMGSIRRFHAKIQWAEREAWWGMLSEVVWFSGMLVLLSQTIKV